MQKKQLQSKRTGLLDLDLQKLEATVKEIQFGQQKIFLGRDFCRKED